MSTEQSSCLETALNLRRQFRYASLESTLPAPTSLDQSIPGSDHVTGSFLQQNLQEL